MFNIETILNFIIDNFRKKLLENLCVENRNTNNNGLEKFLQICSNTLDQMAPRKNIYIRANNMLFFNKELSSAHKKRTQLRNCYLKKRSYQIKGFILSNKIFVFLYNEKLKKAL